jgi:hypothetical protein
MDQLALPEVGVGFVLEAAGFASEAAGFASEAAGFASEAGFDSPFEASGDFDDGFAPLLRKSVAYQPLPFNWKPAALSIFENVGFPQVGHTVSGASLSFCRNSCWCPQLEQRYS